MTSEFDAVDFFTDESLHTDPYPYYDYLRSQCPVRRQPHHGVVAVTGHAEVVQFYKDTENLSSCNAVTGPFPALPFEPLGDDLSEQIASHRSQMPMSEHMVTFDPPEHGRARGLLNRLLTPKRLKENEEFMWRLADEQLDDIVPAGQCEFLAEYAKPFSLLVIADLLGVPAEDHEGFRLVLGAPRLGSRPGALDADRLRHNPLEFLDGQFTTYIEDRRREPRADVLTDLAAATYPDGSVPDVIDVVRAATFLFAAGQETTTKLLTAAVRVLGERPDLGQLLREDRSRIPAFIEEALRVESPVKSDFRLARRSMQLGGVDIPAGATVMSILGAANRDPSRFQNPNEFSIERPNVREHVAFGRGVHSCPGAPLARVEARVTLERMLDRMTGITISEKHHGPANARHYNFEPTYVLRGLTALHIEYSPAA